MARGTVTWEVRDGRAIWDGRLLADWVDELARDIVGEFDPIEVWLFGSIARGEDDGDSDIDLLVVLDHYNPVEAIGLKQRAGRSVTVPVPFDTVFTDSARMLRRRRIAGSIERTAVIHGRRIYHRG